MLNNFIKRTLSSVLLGGLLIFLLLKYQSFYKLLFSTLVPLMGTEWDKINSNKKSWLFYLGWIYIITPICFIVCSQIFDNYTILFLFSIVWSCDIFAYLGGKLIGGPKFSSKISPNKTWSGVICGFIFSFVISYLYMDCIWKVRSETLLYSIPLLIIASILGDLLESKVKRILKVKDTGNIIPGHGGILDRFDSFLLTTYVYILYFIIENNFKYSFG